MKKRAGASLVFSSLLLCVYLRFLPSFEEENDGGLSLRLSDPAKKAMLCEATPAAGEIF
jgi:hypothetical protein